MTDVPDNANEHCVGPASEEAGMAKGCAGCPNQSACAAGEGRKADPTPGIVAEALADVKNVVLVLSGKGGVGKSTVASQLAFTLASEGYSVGLLDVDLCGPSVPRMLGLSGRSVHSSGAGWSPVWVTENLGVMSIGFMLPKEDDAVIWRGPRKNGLIRQFLTEVDWGTLDFLIVDTPPGTSDEHISTVQFLSESNVCGAVVVTTPQEVAMADVRKELSFCAKTRTRVLGVVENMSGFVCECGHETEVFSAPAGSGPRAMSEAFKCPYLGRIPLDPRVLRACDGGQAVVDVLPSSPAAKAILSIASSVAVSAGLEPCKEVEARITSASSAPSSSSAAAAAAAVTSSFTDEHKQDDEESSLSFPPIPSRPSRVLTSTAENETAVRVAEALAGVKNVVLVLSGKGGVGKSTVASQLAFTLASEGYSVGLLDVDLCGPSVPRMLGLSGRSVHSVGAGWSPVRVKENLGVMSIGFMLPKEDDAVIWRGPRKNGLIRQFLTDVDWGTLDFLIVDTPPGTSDEHISTVQFLSESNVCGAVVVTTPQEVAMADVRKELSFCAKTKTRVLGVVENMSGFVCECGHETEVFSAPAGSGPRAMSEAFKCPYLGRIPLDPRVLRACDGGQAVVDVLPDSPASLSFRRIASHVATSAASSIP